MSCGRLLAVSNGNGTLRPILMGLLMAVGGMLPATLLAVENTTWRALIVGGMCLLFLVIGVFLPQPQLPDSLSGRHQTSRFKIAPKKKGPSADTEGPSGGAESGD